ncbi:MAG: hypothetical protein ACI4UH_06240 [Dorea sp.]
MNDAQKRRKLLLEQMRNVYDERRTPPAIHPRYGLNYRKYYEEPEEIVSGTLGIRAFICILLFVCFTIAEQKDMSIMNINSEKVANEIHHNFDFSMFWETI